MTMKIFDDLNLEWSRNVRDRRTLGRIAQWSIAEAELADLWSLDELVAVAHGVDRERADRVLAGLLRIGREDQLAWRTVFQAVMPGLICTARRFVPGPASDEEVAATVVAAAWGRIAGYPLDRRPRSIAANIVLDARQLSSTALFKNANVEVPSSELLVMRPSPPYRPDPAVSLARVLDQAVRSKAVTAEDARLVALTRIHDVPVDVLAKERGVLPHSLRRRRLRTEAAIAAAVA
ncbi:MAG: hypothetical protein AB7W59_14245 [Acidimicrobiia bacterium]